MLVHLESLAQFLVIPIMIHLVVPQPNHVHSQYHLLMEYLKMILLSLELNFLTVELPAVYLDQHLNQLEYIIIQLLSRVLFHLLIGGNIFIMGNIL